jgi:hypothetical protein
MSSFDGNFGLTSLACLFRAGSLFRTAKLGPDGATPEAAILGGGDGRADLWHSYPALERRAPEDLSPNSLPVVRRRAARARVS